MKVYIFLQTLLSQLKRRRPKYFAKKKFPSFSWFNVILSPVSNSTLPNYTLKMVKAPMVRICDGNARKSIMY